MGKGRIRPLPPPEPTESISVEGAIAARRSCREFTSQLLVPAQLSLLCWAASGRLEEEHRTVPSAGALYPIEIYLVSVDGVDYYDSRSHGLRRRVDGDVRPELARASLDQGCVAEAPISIGVAAEIARTARKYGDRAERYCLIEAGHVAQNVLLEAVALGLAGVPVGAYHDDDVAKVLGLPRGQSVLYLLPIGYARR